MPRGLFGSGLSGMWLLLGAALLIVAIGSVSLGPFTQSVLIRAFLFAAVALTVDVLWGYTGILSFGQGAFFGIGAYAAALTFTHVGFTLPIAILALVGCVAIAALIAAAVGWLGFWYRATPFYIAVVTLVLPIVVVQLIYSGGSFTGSSSGLVGFDVPPLSMPGWFFISGIFLVLLTTVLWIFVRSDYGCMLRAIRDNDRRCRYFGINTSRVKIFLMIAMAAVAAVAGYIYACAGTIVAPENAGFIFGTVLVVYVALGGRGTIVGPLIGTIGLVWASVYLSSYLPFVWQLIIGTAFLLVIILLPQGLLPPLWQFFAKRISGERQPRPENAIQITEGGREAVDVASPGTPKTELVAALQLDGVTKNYGSLQVLDGITLTIKGGELVGIVGPNGAGKTTLMRCISDGYERADGRILISGSEIGRRSPTDIVGLGLGRSFQHTSLMESLTVAECLRLARYQHWRPSKVSEAKILNLPAASLEVLERTGLGSALHKKVYHLSHGMKRALELAMVLALEPSTLLLDEPTAGLTKVDREMVGEILVKLRDELGLAIILIEHDFEFVKQVCSRLIVLHQGRLVLDGPVDDVVNSPITEDIYAGGAL